VTTYLSHQQVEALLRPLKSSRVGTTPDGYSHLQSWDIRAALVRVFGFGNWDETSFAPTERLYEVETTTRSGKPAYKVAYIAHRRLSIRTPYGEHLCAYEATAIGESTMPDFKRGDAHDMAIKTAESQALKRCAINLGTMFGLSLYNDGMREDVVGVTLVRPAPPDGGETEPASTDALDGPGIVGEGENPAAEYGAVGEEYS
jgi:hypothetical protein